MYLPFGPNILELGLVGLTEPVKSFYSIHVTHFYPKCHSQRLVLNPPYNKIQISFLKLHVVELINARQWSQDLYLNFYIWGM